MELSILLKLTGAALLVAGCTLFGRSYGNQYRERVDYLYDFHKRLEILKNEIAFFKGVLYDSLLKAAEFTGPAQTLFETMLDQLEGETPVDAASAWETACQISFRELCLTQEEREAMGTLGRLLGASDVEGQLTNIEAIQSQVQQLMETAEEARKKNEPMWKKIGPVAGAAIAIFLL